jgi:hypothetical protein
MEQLRQWHIDRNKKKTNQIENNKINFFGFTSAVHQERGRPSKLGGTFQLERKWTQVENLFQRFAPENAVQLIQV